MNEDVPFYCNSCEFLSRSHTAIMEHRHLHNLSTKNIENKLDNTLVIGGKHQYKTEYTNVYTNLYPTCTQCDATFSRGYNKNRHMRAVHGGEKGPQQIGKLFICPECMYKFPKQYAGCSSHSKRTTFTCEICGYITKEMSQLKAHQASSRCDTQKTVVKSFSCNHCPLGFTTEKAMIRHEKQHVDGKPFKCEHCEIGFSQNYGLKTHLKKGRCKVQRKISDPTKRMQ
jgi:hypothetical protein